MQLINEINEINVVEFQYRKRYGLHAIINDSGRRRDSYRFNTASGTDCMQWNRLFIVRSIEFVSIPQAVRIACNKEGLSWKFLFVRVSIPQAVRIACNQRDAPSLEQRSGFNTASGTDCMQFFSFNLENLSTHLVSIPQAVRIACNHW